MDLSKLETLRDMTVNGEIFADAVEYFMDNFGLNPEFIKLGKRTHNDVVEGGVSQMLTQILRREILAFTIVMTEIPEKGFFHGAFMADGGIGNFFFFKGIGMGIVTGHFPELGVPTLLARLTAFPMPKPQDPKNN
jgi:hypothetical protein